MTTTYATIAEEKNALLESIITKKIKSIQIAVQHAKSINRRDAARPLTLAINCANVTLKLLIENKRQKMELKKVTESIDTLQSQCEENLNRARQNHEVELYALRKDVEKVESENVALLQKIKSFKNLHEVHENARLTNKLNRLNAERIDRLHSKIIIRCQTSQTPTISTRLSVFKGWRMNLKKKRLRGCGQKMLFII